MSLLHQWVVIVCTALLGLSVPAAAADVDLAPRWKAGDEAIFYYTSDATRSDAIPAMKASQEQRTRQEMTIRRKVIETGPDGTTLELVFERIKAVVTQGRMFMLYDSAKPPDPDRSNVLEDGIKPMIGIPMKVKLSPTNVVTEISGFPQPRTVDGNVRPLVVDDELIRNSLAALYGMQKQPTTAKIGDKWTVEEELPGEPGTVLAMRHRRTLEGTDGTTADIATQVNGEIKVVKPGTTPKRLMAGFECSSTHHWDLAKCRLGWMVLDQRTEMHGEIRQARSEHVSTIRITLAAEGFTPPPPPPRPNADGSGAPPGGGSPAPAPASR